MARRKKHCHCLAPSCIVMQSSRCCCTLLRCQQSATSAGTSNLEKVLYRDLIKQAGRMSIHRWFVELLLSKFMLTIISQVVVVSVKSLVVAPSCTLSIRQARPAVAVQAEAAAAEADGASLNGVFAGLGCHGLHPGNASRDLVRRAPYYGQALRSQNTAMSMTIH